MLRAAARADAARAASGAGTGARDYDWPGNIRELQNVVERAVILARGGTIALPLPEPQAVPLPSGAEDVEPQSEVITDRRWRELERSNILRALRRADFRLWGAGGAADLLGVNAATLASRLKKLGIRARDLKSGLTSSNGLSRRR